MHDAAVTDDEPAGLSDERIAQHVTAGRVRVDGERVTDLDTGGCRRGIRSAGGGRGCPPPVVMLSRASGVGVAPPRGCAIVHVWARREMPRNLCRCTSTSR